MARPMMKLVRQLVLYSVLFVLYLASTVPVGLFIYSIKTEVGLDIFREGGFHAYMQCLSASFPIAKKVALDAPISDPQQRCEAKQQPDVSTPASVPAITFEGARRFNEKRGREDAKEQCILEATRLGKAATLWCAGL